MIYSKTGESMLHAAHLDWLGNLAMAQMLPIGQGGIALGLLFVGLAV
jgi:hypothetical protein